MIVKSKFESLKITDESAQRAGEMQAPEQPENQGAGQKSTSSEQQAQSSAGSCNQKQPHGREIELVSGANR